MNKIKRKSLAVLLLAVLLVLFAVSAVIFTTDKNANALVETQEDNYNFTLVENEDGKSSYKVALKPALRNSVELALIPETYNGLPVTEIADNGFMSCTKLLRVVLPSFVKKIGNNAFVNCTNLKLAGLSEVESIGTNAFGMCKKLERLYIPKTVKTVGANILRNNPNTVYLQSSLAEAGEGWDATWNNYHTGEIIEEAVLEDTLFYREIKDETDANVIGYELSEDNVVASPDADIVIYNSFRANEDSEYLPVLNICAEAFWYAEANSITIRDRHADDPSALEFNHKINIRSNAFYLAQVNKINFEVGITTYHSADLQVGRTEGILGNPICGDENGYSTEIFAESAIKSVTLPADLTFINERMFFNCTMLESIKIYGQAYDGKNILPEVTKIGNEAFSSCGELKEITIPSSVEEVGTDVFYQWGTVDTQTINIDIYEDEIPAGWNENWTANIADAEINYKALEKVTINWMDAENCTTEIFVKPGDMLPDLDKIERAGCVFKGIFSGVDGTGFQYYTSEMVSARVWNKGDATTLYAYWILIPYEITYDVDWKGLENPNPTYYTVEDEITFIKLEKPGYTFEWEPASIEKNTTGNLIVEGIWQTNEYEITFVDDSGLSNPNKTRFTVEDEFEFEKLSMPGYTFEWQPSGIVAGTTDDVTVYGVWSVIEYDLNYYFEGQLYEHDTFTYFDTVNIADVDCGWYWIVWDIHNISEGTSHGVNVYGTKVAKTYTINYNVWQGTQHNNPTSYECGKELILQPATYVGYYVSWNANTIPAKFDTSTVTVTASYVEKTFEQCLDSEGWYSIVTANQLRGYRNITVSDSTKVRLFADIDLGSSNWTAFELCKGIFDGQSHTITFVNLSLPEESSYAFFLENQGTIRNLKIKAKLKGESSYMYFYSGLVATNKGTVDNCQHLSYIGTNSDGYSGTNATVDIHMKYDNCYCSGLIGQNFGTVRNCTNYASLCFMDCGGGIVARNEDGGTIYNCSNYGDIYILHQDSQFCPLAGGVTGSSLFNSSVTYVYNYATITLGSFDTSQTLNGLPVIAQIAGSMHDTVTFNNYYCYGNVVINPSINFRQVSKEYITNGAVGNLFTYTPPTTGGGECVASGTLITLADGRQVPVESLTGSEMLLVWNLYTGSYDVAPIIFVDSDPMQMYEVINLYFSDGSNVKVISEHGFWDYDLNEYVYLRNDAAKYIGHWFNKQTDNSDRVQLVNVVVREEYTTAWSPVTYGHLCYYVNGMLSMPGGISGLFNIFEVNSDTMQYNEAAMNADIEAYGLFTYEEFADIFPITEEMFNAFSGQYLKVSIGKGLISMERIGDLITHYAEFLS